MSPHMRGPNLTKVMADSRIDKFLWAIRVYKTRSEATEACKGNKVKLNGVNAKPSKLVNTGDKIEVRKGAVLYSYKVKVPLEKRVGAALVPDFAENLTPQSELNKLKSPNETFFLHRDRGQGRPTKKDRRDMEDIWNAIDFSDYPDDDE